MKLIPYPCKILVKHDTSADALIGINSPAIEPVELNFGTGLICKKSQTFSHLAFNIYC